MNCFLNEQRRSVVGLPLTCFDMPSLLFFRWSIMWHCSLARSVKRSNATHTRSVRQRKTQQQSARCFHTNQSPLRAGLHKTFAVCSQTDDQDAWLTTACLFSGELFLSVKSTDYGHGGSSTLSRNQSSPEKPTRHCLQLLGSLTLCVDKWNIRLSSSSVVCNETGHLSVETREGPVQGDRFLTDRKYGKGGAVCE